MIRKKNRRRSACTRRLGHGRPKRAKTPWLRLASVLTVRLALVPTIRWALVLAPMGRGAIQVVKVRSQKGEEKEREQLDTASGAVRSPLLFCDFDLDPNRLHGGER